MQQGKLNVFRASAGSGKTFELTAQYVSLLLSCDIAQPHTILAVTFTQKATQEMKTRILEHLYDIAFRSPDAKPDDFLTKVIDETKQTADVLQRRAKTALSTILHNYDDFYVQTIDSFLQHLLRGLAHELGVSAGYQVDIDDNETIQRAVDRLIQELPQHKSILDWVTRFAIDHMEDKGSWNVVWLIKDLAKQINKEAFAKDRDLLKNKLDNETVGEYQRKLREIRDAAINKLKDEARSLQASFGDGTRFNRGGTVAGYIARLAADKPDLKEPGKLVSGYILSPDNWLTIAGATNPFLVDEANQLRPQLAALEELRKKSLHIINSCDISLAQLGELRLLGEIDKLITDINDESGRFLLSRTPLLFNSLVKDGDTAFIYERAGVQFRHIMIDEFQDTSSLQWNIFRRLIDESLASNQSSMVVGDVKQSIYRWRNGNWETLAGIEGLFRNDQIFAKPLDINYRSDKSIVEFNNAFFESAISNPLFTANNSIEEQNELKKIYSDVEQIFKEEKDAGYVRVSISNNKGEWPDIPETEEEEETVTDPLLEDLAQQIFILHDTKGVPFREMAILLRKNYDAVRIIQYMANYHPDLPLISAEAFRLNSSPAVQTVIATLRYLLHRSDTAAQLYMLHRYYTTLNEVEYSWEELIAKKDELIPEPLKKELPGLYRLPLYEKCERIISLLNLNKMDGQQDYLFCFLDGVKAFLQSERSDLKLFLQHWDEKLQDKAIASATTEGVQLITIHKSKGLAFHTVLIPYIKWELQEDSKHGKKSTIWCKPGVEPYSDLPLLPMEVKKKMQDSIYRDQYNNECFHQRVENLNLLYVAFTRAKHNLYLWVDTNNAKSSQSVGILVADFVLPKEEKGPFLKTFGTLADYKEKSETNSSEPNPLRKIPETLYLSMPDGKWRAEFKQSTRAMEFMASSDEEKAAQQTYIDRGKVLHSIFEHIATANDVNQAVSEAVQQGLLPANEEAKTRSFVTQRISEGTPATWFDGSWQLFRECTILKRTEQGTLQRRRPDRVMERDGRTIVVDYKFGTPKREHALQVDEYMELLRSMGKSHVEGYVWYVLQNQIVSVPSSNTKI